MISKSMGWFKLLPLLALLISSCASVKNGCPDNPSTGNPGSVLNSSLDELTPFLYDNYLYYTTSKPQPSAELETEYHRSGFLVNPYEDSQIDKSFPLADYPGSVAPSLFEDINTGKKELYFASFTEIKGKKNSDIYVMTFTDGRWSDPVPIPGVINTASFESHPCIADNGKMLVFTSDRPGGFGQTDIYYSRRNEDGSWSEPVNFGSGINTPKQEITPYMSDRKLIYASRGFGNNTGYDLIIAKEDSAGWQRAFRLKEPLNSNSDEYFPLLSGNDLLFSSNRPGGCGGFDLYQFPLCGPVIVECSVTGASSSIQNFGSVTVFNQDGTKYKHAKFGNDTLVDLQVEPDREYTFVYNNECIIEANKEIKIVVPCSDSSTTKIFVKFSLPESDSEFTFEKYDVPFFVSGYYLPNTSKNLDALRMKFSYNLIGNTDSTRYIENPGTEYDKYTQTVEKALDDAVAFILASLEPGQSGCFSGEKMLKVNVVGYADPRQISDIARFDGPDIDDTEFNFKATRGDKMTNLLLSRLRAYYTAKYLEKYLNGKDTFSRSGSKLHWSIEGKGEDQNTDKPNELKRRVDVVISAESD